MQHQKSLTLPKYVQPLSRRSQSNSHAMTVKEHESRKRSLSLCSISEHLSGSRQKQVEKAIDSKEEIESSPANMQRVMGMNVVLTPMGNESNNAVRNLNNINSIFHETRI